MMKVSNIHASPNVWDVLRKQFTLNHEVMRPEVQNQIRWIVAHPTYLQRLSRSEPYIYHIASEITKRKIPGEIALIPIIESAFDPFAYSGAGASGLWQLMPGTGTDLGLKQDWWFDGRRSIRPSTNAALNYLIYLNKFFNGNWNLAFAAYDSGEGTIRKLIKKNGRRGSNFWTLPVPQETKAYVPRLLALAAIIKNPHHYNVHLPDIPHVPYFEEVNIGSQIDLSHAARLAGISYKELIKLNPGYNRWATAPYHPYKLLLPITKIKAFNKNLANFPIEKRVSWTRHQVISGDNLVAIAKKYHTTVKLIQELNQLKTTSLKKRQYILVPSASNSPKPIEKKTHTTTLPVLENKHYKVIHIVQKNDAFASLQQKYHVSEDQIRHWNLIGPQIPLRAGQKLLIWRKTQGTTYTVSKGDNLSTIAKRINLKLSAILKLNPNLNRDLVHPGQKIIIS